MSDEVHVMIDLETMGTDPDSPVLSIGAVVFDPFEGVLGDEFYSTVSIRDELWKGLAIDADTLRWWMQQPDDARSAVTRDAIPAKEAARFLRLYQNKVCEGQHDRLRIWGNGADFDPVITERFLKRHDEEVLWKHHAVRCYRTLKKLRPGIKAKRVGTHHNALDDAKTQALHAIKLLRSLMPTKYGVSA